MNCLEPHPYMPVLATSGLDDDVKLWIASRDQPPDLSSVKEVRPEVIGDGCSRWCLEAAVELLS